MCLLLARSDRLSCCLADCVEPSDVVVRVRYEVDSERANLSWNNAGHREGQQQHHGSGQTMHGERQWVIDCFQ